ncbi:MAG: RNA 2',3'-cyclic phosphodiesterase [Candidatus Aenigmarchaeota archaeon]|nr:RNA 2',3'-cyclic phosphodiesterase [Candidatus Aenigmarchaeota archaeon]
MVRVFVGILLPDSLKDIVAGLQGTLGNLPMKCKFTERENLHISLDFIGEIEQGNLESIKNKISDIAKRTNKFQIEFVEMKLIPNERLVRVIGLEVKSPELEALGREMKEKIGGDVKPPHLTLCRVKNILPRNGFIEMFQKIKKERIPSFEVKSIQLIESRLSSKGPAYSVVSDFSLA